MTLWEWCIGGPWRESRARWRRRREEAGLLLAVWRVVRGQR